MPRLILLNGAPGVGKSTVARRWADDRDLVLVLDVDLVRAMLSTVDGDVTASFLAARAIALAMAGVHLRAGHDVVVPQHLGRPEFIDQLAATASAAGAGFVEVVLTIDRAQGKDRFITRGDVPQLAGATETWEQLVKRLHRLLATRPHVVRVDASGDPAATAAAFARAVAVPDPAGPGR